MPFVSKKQQRYMYANNPAGVDLDEWAKETDFSKLPEEVRRNKSKTKKPKKDKKAKKVDLSELTEKKAFWQGFIKAASVAPEILPAELPKANGSTIEDLSTGEIARRIKAFEASKCKEKKAAVRTNIGSYINKRIQRLAAEQGQSLNQLVGKSKKYKPTTVLNG